MLPNHSQPPFFHQQHHPTEHLQSASQDPAQHAASLLDADPSTLGFDFDDFESSPSKHPSLSSSPVSTQSVLSQYSSIDSSPLSTFDSIPTPTQLCEGPLFPPPPQSGQAVTGPSAPLFAQSGAMQTEAWVPNAHQVTPRSVSHFSHNRESSRSSLGSNGPLSPFSHNFANPQIAVNDSIGDAFPVFHGADDFNNYQLAAKSLPGVTHDNFYTSTPPSYGAADSASYPYVATAPRRRNDRGLMPPSDHATGSSRSQPVSVASSIASDSPATPAGEPEEDKRHNTGEISSDLLEYFLGSLSSASHSPPMDEAAVPAVPKLGRTMTDAFNDELFNPNFTITSSSSGPTSISPTSDVFNQRLQAANNQHLSAVTSSSMSATSRDRSPFRQGSPFAHLPLHELPPSIGSSQARFGSAQQMREQSKALHDAQAMQQHIARSTDTSTPQTISPKDAMLEFHEPDGEANFPLFPQQNTTAGFNADAINKAAAAHGQQQPVFHGLPMDNGALNNFLASSVPGPVPVPQHYPFIPQQRPQSAVPSVTNESPAATRLGSADTATTESAHSGTPHRIDDTRANGGTYTCTYHGCTQRFATPALLQKHKREGHRQAHGLGGVRRPDGTGMTSSLLNTQAGPHRCDRLNPSTGKPCNAVFSRPYDLTRHEGTIHNPNKQKVRCDLCTEDKTFSRADALTRHYKVCHPEIEFPGKQRRRGGHSDN